MSGSNQGSTGSGTRSAIGGTSGTSGTSGNQNMHYNTPAIQVGNEVRDGDQFILLTKSRQSDEFQVWASGDQVQAQDLLKQATRQLDFTPA